jgi:hypothetical protein
VGDPGQDLGDAARVVLDQLGRPLKIEVESLHSLEGVDLSTQMLLRLCLQKRSKLLTMSRALLSCS